MVSGQQIHAKVSVIEMCTLSSATIVTKTTSCNFGFLERNSIKTLKTTSFHAKNHAKIKPKKQAKPYVFANNSAANQK